MVVRTMPYKVVALGLSDVGQVRQNNEDVWAEVPELFFYVLADGMGGHQAGEVAAHQAVDTICKIVKNEFGDPKRKIGFHDSRKALQLAFEQVNSMIYKMGRSDPELKGMGTTLCCLFLHEKGLVYGHVGDSRIYRMRRKKLEQLTKDHSLFRELVDLGQLSEHQATDFLYKNIITKAIGTEPRVDPSVHLSDIEVGDTFLMCSDGLSDLLSIKEIEGVITQHNSIKEAVNELIASANARGGHDNITVVIIKVLEINENKDLSR